MVPRTVLTPDMSLEDVQKILERRAAGIRDRIGSPAARRALGRSVLTAWRDTEDAILCLNRLKLALDPSCSTLCPEPLDLVTADVELVDALARSATTFDLAQLHYLAEVRDRPRPTATAR